MIQNTQTFKDPKIELEQYSIDATSAVDIAYFAGFEFNDINNRMIIDLGAGTGRLSIACAFLKAKHVISIDIDNDALLILKKNIIKLNLDNLIYPVCTDVKNFELKKTFLKSTTPITTIMNPPFGVQRRNADRYFIEKAFSFSNTIYSIHLANKKVHEFILNYIKKFNWIIDNVIPFNLILERSFEFHTQKTKKINVNIYRFIKK